MGILFTEKKVFFEHIFIFPLGAKFFQNRLFHFFETLPFPIQNAPTRRGGFRPLPMPSTNLKISRTHFYYGSQNREFQIPFVWHFLYKTHDGPPRFSSAALRRGGRPTARSNFTIYESDRKSERMSRRLYLLEKIHFFADVLSWTPDASRASSQ